MAFYDDFNDDITNYITDNITNDTDEKHQKNKKICPKHTDIHPTSDIGQQPLANYIPRWNLFRRGQKYNKAQGKREVK